jgi:hypothetical protein
MEIIINDDILNKAVEISGIKDHQKIAERSIEQFIAFEAQKKLRKLKGKIEWEGDLNELRKNRNDFS